MRTLSVFLCGLAASIAVSACQLDDAPDERDEATLSSKAREGGGAGGANCYWDTVRYGCDSCIDYRGRPGELSEIYQFCCDADGTCEWTYSRDDCKYEPACVVP